MKQTIIILAAITMFASCTTKQNNTIPESKSKSVSVTIQSDSVHIFSIFINHDENIITSGDFTRGYVLNSGDEVLITPYVVNFDYHTVITIDNKKVLDTICAQNFKYYIH